MAFESEMALTQSFIESMESDLSRLSEFGVDSKFEVKAPGGIPDFVLYRRIKDSLHYVIAVEFKLKNWRRALTQAFRYRNFSNEVYVILDHSSSNPAQKNIEMFIKSNIGLITMDQEDGVNIIYRPFPDTPFSDEFSLRVAAELLNRYEYNMSNLPFITSVKGGKVFGRVPQIH